MTTLNRFGCFLLISFIVFGLLAATPAFAQTRKAAESAESETATKELVTEVRLLRVALEQNQKLLLQLLSLSERMRAQHEVVLQVSRDLEETRRRLSESKYSPEGVAATIAEMERQVSVGVATAAPLQRLKAEFEQQTQRDRELRDLESSLVSQLKTERAKLAELNQRLEALEREIMR